ncbi:MAG: C40 family peptidase [Fibromonadaceae bacterium]|jgi:probable lipoprotein NlpC|nr:C40 family peptidase [Fibromonadaceae bacterium]
MTHKWLIIIASIGIFSIACAPLRPLGPDMNLSARTAAAQKWIDSRNITGISEWDNVLLPWLGTPYKYGGNTKRGTDCSGFVSSVYMEKERMSVPRTTKDGFKNGKSVDRSSLVVGDLVFFSREGRGNKVNHVGIYVGDGNFMHASTSLGVTITPLDDSHWKTLYLGARRYL